ncbi:MAG: hypothetical protein IJ315_09240, partial [Firmicutes bacterium]|nr:hypothetical protein [Bacillota bacterium]
MHSYKTPFLCLLLLFIALLPGTESLNWLMSALSPIFLAVFIIYFLQPFVNNLQRVSSLPRWLCILLSFLCIILILFLFVFLLIPRLKIFLSLDYSAILPYFPLEQSLQNLLTPLAHYSASVIHQMGNLGMSLCIAFYALLDCTDL